MSEQERSYYQNHMAEMAYDAYEANASYLAAGVAAYYAGDHRSSAARAAFHAGLVL